MPVETKHTQKAMSLLVALSLSLVPALAAAAPNHTLAYMPWSWDTVPRYTFCVNSSGPFNDAALQYVAKQDIFLNNPALKRPPGSIDPFEARAAAQAKALRAINPKQRQWFYYAMDLLRPHNFENDHWVDFHPECRLKDVDGRVIDRPVWDFGTECGVERWLNTSRLMITEGGLNGVFIDGFQGCNPFSAVGCERVCKDAKCDPGVMKKWNEGLVAAMWRLKREILGDDGELICNYTPGPFLCDPSRPVSECPCDGTNDERGAGNWGHMEDVDAVDISQDDYLMLTHVPHGNEDKPLLDSLARFLVAAEPYQYHGAGFGYECGSGGWLERSDAVEHAYAAPLGAPLAAAAETKGCAVEKKCCAKDPTCDKSCRAPGEHCIRTRAFSEGTSVFVNYTSSASCIAWADGRNTSNAGKKGVDGCAQAAAYAPPSRP